jgi:hypothetical protein
MNQIALPDEKESNNEPPNGIGYLAGLQYSHFFGDWGSVFFLEFIYTDPYLYLNSSPFSSHIQMHGSHNAKQNYYYYIGYPRDTIALTLGTRFFNQDTLSFEGEFSWISRGQHNQGGLKWDWKKGSVAFEETTPSGIPENNFLANLSARWKLLPYLSLNASLAGIFVLNNNHNSGSNAAGVQVSFAVNFRY